ncbi:hypothetical protein T265_07545 [Opisthorchis viverrini]|uniref:Uncharacterized protein n=1 Tax=Opisthorchis viverrini TaxID=6198 RepID=A0A074ZNL2_OPIVI|nr:hypothetical protein T265_07545 [Opisthorchis viverrini]KER24925.1 hypothetical protein T265_07545 [Opisthorchis viverrini]
MYPRAQGKYSADVYRFVHLHCFALHNPKSKGFTRNSNRRSQLNLLGHATALRTKVELKQLRSQTASPSFRIRCEPALIFCRRLLGPWTPTIQWYGQVIAKFRKGQC